ncbi:MAG: hypothetical protein VZQ47_05175 [Treponema sp.]|nr:hypothetical protein [Treponema sp.]MEE3434926.1 hypothetical protein [Treponema sp.]
MEENLDPSIAALLASVTPSDPDAGASASGEGGDSPDVFGGMGAKESNFEQMFMEQSAPQKKSGPVPEVDLSIKEFKPIEKVFEEESQHYFDDPTYYKTAIAGEGQASNRLHMVLSKYLSCKDVKDKMVYRQQVTMAYWELVHTMAPKTAGKNFPLPKRMMLRFSVLLPSLFRPEHREFFEKSILENNTNEPVFYMDEWFKYISQGKIKPSTTDEVRQPRKTGDDGGQAEQLRLQQLQSKNSGKLQQTENSLSMAENQRGMLEAELKSKIDQICEHESLIGMEPHKQPYNDLQKKLFGEVTSTLRLLSKNDRDLSIALREYQDAKAAYDSVEEKLEAGPEVTSASSADIDQEFETVRQMAKMTCGRQGNQFPIFTRDFFHCMANGTGFRENVIKVLAWVESLDPGAFCRIHKNTPNRIVPFVILLPTYGDRGFCWEPFDRYNRVTSRGRIVVPMYPRDLKIAVLTAVADLRWQVAKEKASYYWMEEGLTGQYYEWIDKQKLKGDLKQYFIQDYILWMTKESEGVQRLDKEVRGIFWRNMPFPQELKEDLRKRSLVYDELCKKDMNRAMSDGY